MSNSTSTGQGDPDGGVPAARDMARAPALHDVAAEATESVTSRPPHSEPTQIGSYSILETLGEGGMGVVYKAEQKKPVRRLVALKVIKLGMDTKEVIARFEVERQALALMSHPNVAKVYEAGTTEQGRPYFAMEFVAGIPIVRYCDECRLTTRERLELFVQVCHAVQHAHQKGIIHRDIKPSNILVTHFDSRPVPKVIDFGIAKAANQALTEMTLYTRTGSLIGTPEYMSPEQALTSGLDVDTRTDIYSLGVVLYELLTGTLPLDPLTLHQAGIERMAQIIKTAEPPKPSTRLSMLDGACSAASQTAVPLTAGGRTSSGSSLAEVASLRRSDPRSLRRELRGDLDWIVLKAMEKDRTRRYETANGLAMDVRRHLDKEPINARPPSAAYRTSKFISKHRVGVTGAVGVVLALGLGLALATYGLVRARHERDLARIAEQKEAEHRRTAETATENSNQTTRLMGGLFTDDAPAQFALSARRLEAGWLADQPDPQAALRITLAIVGLNNSLRVSPEQTSQQLTATIDLLPRLIEPRRSEVSGAAHYLLGLMNEKNNKPAAAEQEYRNARLAYQSFPGTNYFRVETLTRLAELCKGKGDLAESGALRFEWLSEDVRYGKPFVDGSSSGPLHKRYGAELARLGQFRPALLQWDRAAELEPKNDTNWLLRGCLLAYLEEPDQYRKNCRGMAQQFGDDTDSRVIDHTAKTCLLLPDSGVPLATLREMVDRDLDLTRGVLACWAHLADGMMRYRQGDFTGCLVAMERCKQTPDDENGVRAMTADLFTAMAQWKLGQTVQAKTTFSATDRLFRTTLPRAGEADLTKNGAIYPENWFIAHVAHREAQSLLEGSEAATRPSS